jgi:putative iron-only hydrogenase system regulator
MQSKVAVIGVIVESLDDTAQLNEILHEYAPYVIGRMGIPYHKRGISVLSVAVDAPQEVVDAMAGKIGAIPGISTTVAYSNAVFED